MDIEIANVDKLKVAELRALLSSHELDTKGTKPILVARLTSYLESLPPKDPNAPVVEAVAVVAPEADEETPDAEGMLYLIIVRYLYNRIKWNANVWYVLSFHLYYSIIGTVFRKNRSDFSVSFFVPTFTCK